MDAPGGDLRWVLEGTRGELSRYVEALAAAGIRGWIRPKESCLPTA